MKRAVDESTTLEKFTAAMTAFGSACVTFLLAAVVFVPLTSALSSRMGAHEALTKGVLLLELLGLPVVAALLGISFAVRPIVGRQSVQTERAD